MTYRYKVRFFRPEEFICPCCGKGQVAELLVFCLDMFRAAWGYPVKINSAYRCEEHNDLVGGAEKSRHLIGCAADIAPIFKHRAPGEMEDFKFLARRMFVLPKWEVKLYPWGVHVAVPREEASRLWNGDIITL